MKQRCLIAGLFYRAMPDKTLAEKGDAVKGGKIAMLVERN